MSDRTTDFETIRVLSLLGDEPMMATIPEDGAVVAMSGMVMPFRVFAWSLSRAISQRHHIPMESESLLDFAKRHGLNENVTATLNSYENAVFGLIKRMASEEPEPRQALLDLIARIDTTYAELMA